MSWYSSTPAQQLGSSRISPYPRPRPFVKWAGGKRQLIDILLENVPAEFNRYIEPFVGGGALLFALTPQRAIISDINRELIHAYRIIKKDVEHLIEKLKKYKNDKETFYQLRALNPGTLPPIERACRFIYLNKTCYNGLYRENSLGQFNAPFGKYKSPTILDADNLRRICMYFKVAKIMIYEQDFEETVDLCERGDFIYFDPPYHPLSDTARFTKYSKVDFNIDEQRRLARVYRELDKKGCYVLLSNSNTPLIRELYADYHVKIIHALRTINCKADKRQKGGIEVLIRNW